MRGLTGLKMGRGWLEELMETRGWGEVESSLVTEGADWTEEAERGLKGLSGPARGPMLGADLGRLKREMDPGRNCHSSPLLGSLKAQLLQG